MTTIEYWTALGAIGTIAYCIITAVTMIFLGVQLYEARRNTLGQFVNQLGKEFEELNAAFEPFVFPGSNQMPSDDQALRCLQFFERAKNLSDIGVLNIRILDAMFGYQFFSLVNDPHVQNTLLYNEEHYFPEVFALHQQLIALRTKSGIEVPRTTSDLAAREPNRYEINLRHYQDKRTKKGLR